MPNTHCECEWLEEDETCSEPIYAEYDGRRYCVLHYPDSSKKQPFEEALQARLDEKHEQYLKFVGVWFPDELPWVNQTFTAPVDFSRARFSSDVDFSHCDFHEIDFSGAQFTGYVDFEDATFLETATFFGTHFKQSASFALATFVRNGSFDQAKFSGHADFAGIEFQENASFMLARFENIADFSAARIPDSDGSYATKYPMEWKRSRFANAYFTGTMFTRCNFRFACFEKAAHFKHAVIRDSIDFSITDFNESDFSNSLLTHANFDGTFFLRDPKFNKTEFMHTTVFSTTRLPGADFSEAVFSGNADFSAARLENSVSKWEVERLQECHEIGEEVTSESHVVRISFDRATFKEGLTFKATDFFQDRCLLTFEDAIFEKPERVKFQSVSMPPHSFMNVDPRKFHFMDVRWGFIDRRKALDEAQAALKKHERPYSLPMLELVYRQLAVNAEENNRYGQAADLRYLAMEVARAMRWRKVDVLNLAWWYRVLSGYGEKVRRAFLALVVIWFAFALIYWSWNDATWWQPKQTMATAEEKSQKPTTKALTFPEALLYSGGVMALQKPEPLPANKRAKFFVLFETILGPLQAALLALAIRRKFMR